MAFITLRRSRGTRSYYLVESYRDEESRSRKRTLCYLGREQDEIDTLDKAIAHWTRIAKEANREIATAPTRRHPVLKARIQKSRERVELLRHHARLATRLAAERRAKQTQRQTTEDAHRHKVEEAAHWQAIERLYRSPSPENAQSAKRAFRMLALRFHPDQGGRREDFIRLK